MENKDNKNSSNSLVFWPMAADNKLHFTICKFVGSFCRQPFLLATEEVGQVGHLVGLDRVDNEHVRLLRRRNEDAENHLVANL